MRMRNTPIGELSCLEDRGDNGRHKTYDIQADCEPEEGKCFLPSARG